MNALDVVGLSVDAGGRRIVAAVDLAVETGEFVGVVGPNGAGKTTLLAAIAGLVPSFGSVRVAGRDIASMNRSERAVAVAIVPQRPVIPTGMTVVEYALLGRTPHLGLLAAESGADIDAARASLDSLGVLEFAERDVDSLSGGEVQRAVLARALTQGSPLMLLDEPTSALDLGHAQRVLGLVDDLRRSCGVTVVAAIHDLTLASQFCDRLVMMSQGRVVAGGTPADVLTEDAIRLHYGASVSVVSDDGGVVVVPRREQGLPTASSAPVPPTDR